MKSIGVTGYKGRLGTYLLNHFSNYVPLECDVTNVESTFEVIKSSDVDFVLHLAAKSDVNFCEKTENKNLTILTNVRGTAYVAHAAQRLDIPILLLSSDHVFGGIWGNYKEKDKPNPKNSYGFSKLGAESLQKVFNNLYIVRTSYLFDDNRVADNLAKMWNGQPELYPTFITRSFMYLPHFSESLDRYINSFPIQKVLHISGNKVCSWWEFMTELTKEFGFPDYKKLIVPRKTESLHYAPRPLHAGLNVSLSKKLKLPQYSYLDGIKQLLKDIGK